MQMFRRRGHSTKGSVSRQISTAALIVGFFTVVVKLIAIVKESVVAWRFGTQGELDTFLIAFLVPAFVINVVANSFSAALIPTYIQVRETEGMKAAQKLFSGTMVWSIGLLSGLMVLMVATAPVYLHWIASAFDAQKLTLTFNLLIAVSPVVLLAGIAQTWSAVLNAGERFALAAFTPVLTPGMTIVCLVSFRNWGVYSLIVGLLVGVTIELALLGVTLKRQGMSLWPRWTGLDDHLRQVIGQYAPMIAGGVLICSAGIIDQAMAAMLMPGSVSALNYGERVVSSLVNLISTALSTAVIPYFSKLISTEDWSGTRNTLFHYLKLIFLITIPITSLLLIFSEFTVRVLFQHGSFTSSDTQLIAQIQRCFALQIPFYIANILVVRLISSMRMNQILLWVSAFDLIVNIVANYVFMQWMGIQGIALSTSCVYGFSFVYVLIAANRKLNQQMLSCRG